MWRADPGRVAVGARRDDEAGVALITALFAVLVMTGLATLLVATSINQSRFTGVQRDYEVAVHVAEAGSDEVIARLNRDKDFITRTSGGTAHSLDLTTHPDEASQRQWAIDAVKTDSALAPLTSGPKGEGFGIRPWDPNAGKPHDFIFGVSFVPNRADPERVRVVKLRFDRKLFEPQHGLMACGDLSIAGGSAVAGVLGSVHSNGNVTLTGSNYSIEQALTAAGTISGDTSKAGSAEALAAKEFCPEVLAKDFYGRAELPYTCYDPLLQACVQRDGSDAKAVLWWDLCPDGTVRRASSSPCAGTVVWNGSTSNHLGWTFQVTNATPVWSVKHIQSGVYYVHRGEAKISGQGRGTVTVLAAKDDTDGGKTGNLSFTGTSKLDAALDGLLMVTDRDFSSNGNAAGGVSGLEGQGLIAVGEQAKLDGNAKVTGSVYVRNDPHTAASPVSSTTLSGNFGIVYDEELDVPLVGIVRITAWNEI